MLAKLVFLAAFRPFKSVWKNSVELISDSLYLAALALYMVLLELGGSLEPSTKYFYVGYPIIALVSVLFLLNIVNQCKESIEGVIRLLREKGGPALKNNAQPNLERMVINDEAKISKVKGLRKGNIVKKNRRVKIRSKQIGNIEGIEEGEGEEEKEKFVRFRKKDMNWIKNKKKTFLKKTNFERSFNLDKKMRRRISNHDDFRTTRQ